VIYHLGRIPTKIADVDSNIFLNFIGNVHVPEPSTVNPQVCAIVLNLGRRDARPKLYVHCNFGPHRRDVGCPFATAEYAEWAPWPVAELADSSGHSTIRPASCGTAIKLRGRLGWQLHNVADVLMATRWPGRVPAAACLLSAGQLRLEAQRTMWSATTAASLNPLSAALELSAALQLK